ncbi:glycoside hydrolase family 20 protein [Teredinibacter sp. KSP-S5-2]|uniref:glycoside hydrolase family 20 protein n=1 Tax=Teredinibacter sp. KSP-S5-2 TaxID=3034506 RepID=UPI002934376A|nr:glycoside hydrolase family 20 protein [Teredinibacter sp. KSP-S5-2]WNO08676.1 glycoside hydrolase family 20 protein [Teredinibacter sp. KSP-S5-2]
MFYSRFKFRYLLFAALCLQFSAVNSFSTPVDDLGLIPQPQSIVVKDGEFRLTRHSQLFADSTKSAEVAEQFAQRIRRVTGYLLPVHIGKKPAESGITFTLSAKAAKGDGYRIDSKAQGIHLSAATETGLFYAGQSLRQMFDSEIEHQAPINKAYWALPLVDIQDQPRFEYRGMHLDVARHFFTVDEVKKYIDLIALHKMNYLHLHLTDDQGWRIEIKQYPLLTEVGGTRAKTISGHTYDYQPLYDNKPVSGFYTQQELKDLIQYAAQRHITIVPEIDVPGHATAILAAYPELGCHDKTYEVESHFGIFTPILCPKEETFAFLENVFAEVAVLFPGPYIHLGGDEAVKDDWKNCAFCQQLMQEQGIKTYEELQAYFIGRVDRMITKLGKQSIGWDEILQGNERSQAIVMSWTGIEGGVKAAKQKRKVIMSPYAWVYFDHYQSRNLNEPKAIHGLTPLKKVYDYEPVPQELSAREAKWVIGASGALWTEYVKQYSQAEYMVVPRISALAEVLWTPKKLKRWSSFNHRLVKHFKRLDELGVNASRSGYNVYSSSRVLDDGQIEVVLATDSQFHDIRYTLDGKAPSVLSSVYQKPIVLSKPVEIRAIAQDKMTGHSFGDFRLTVTPHKALGKTLTFVSEPEAGGISALQDGLMAYDQHYNVLDWGVFYGVDMVANIDLEKVTDINRIQFGLDAGRHRQLHPPKAITIEVSGDNQTWQTITRVDNSDDHIGPLFDASYREVKARYLRIHVQNRNNSTDPQIPKLPLYIDEIVVQ